MRRLVVEAVVVALRLAIGAVAVCAWIALVPVATRLGLPVGGPCPTTGTFVFLLLVPVWFGLAAWRSGGIVRRLVPGGTWSRSDDA
jgi:hypothetical protein